MQGFSTNLQRRSSQWQSQTEKQQTYQTGEGNSRQKRKSSVEKSKKKRKSAKRRRVEFHQDC